MKTKLRYAVSLAAVCAVVSLTPVLISKPVFAQETGMVSRVEVKGTERVDPATVLSYMTVKPGDNYNQEALSESAKAIYGTGLFADVNIQPKGGVLVVNVVENPLINQIAFEGNDEIKDDELMAEVASRPRNVLARNTILADVERLQDVYRRQGRYSVAVEPKVIRLDQNRVNLVFEVNEGPESEIRGVKFVGNTEFSDDSLREVIASKESRWFRFLSNNDRYDGDRLAYDQELLRRFYLREGYADFRVVSSVAELTPDKESFFVTFTVDEGQRYKVGNVSVDASALRDADPKIIESENTIDAGDWYDADEVQDVVDAMTNALGQTEQNFLAVTPDIQRNPDSQTVDIVFRTAPTPKVYVERIDIKGNVRTQDKVIRREFELAEGDAFSKTKVAKAENKLKDLDFFDEVKVRPTQGSAPDQTVVEVDVQEKSTGEISLGAGFSTSEGPLADFGIKERNFLGKGQELAFSTAVSGERTEFDVSFTEPYFLDRDLSAGIDAFHTTRDLQSESSYDQKRTGGALRIGYPLSQNLRQTLRYRLENNNIENVEADASRFIREQEGERLTSAFSQRLVYDTRDSALYPTRGFTSWLDAEFAGLGGDAEYISGKIGTNAYYPITKDWILNGLIETGAISGWGDDDTRINERFFIGGNSLRGFSNSGIGPRDIGTDDALGGNLFYRGSVEMSFPLGLPEELGVKGHAFNDFGSLWSIDETDVRIVDENTLRMAAGLGVSWRSPFGPIRLDYAEPYVSEDYDKEEKFRFSFGTRF
ncbi:MAG: outer membrane protein assembly factor BamA [Proteobacteria bacterium]|nr:outer membrane protein assembly factor BamA [Pseudomonadota bacterium]